MFCFFLINLILSAPGCFYRPLTFIALFGEKSWFHSISFFSKIDEKSYPLKQRSLYRLYWMCYIYMNSSLKYFPSPFNTIERMSEGISLHAIACFSFSFAFLFVWLCIFAYQFAYCAYYMFLPADEEGWGGSSALSNYFFLVGWSKIHF